MSCSWSCGIALHYIRVPKEFVRTFWLNVCFLKIIEINNFMRIKIENVFMKTSRGN